MGCGTSTSQQVVQETEPAKESAPAKEPAPAAAEKPTDPDKLDDSQAFDGEAPKAKSSGTSPRPAPVDTSSAPAPTTYRTYSTNEEDDFQCIDMDSPGGQKKSQAGAASLKRTPSQMNMKVGSQSQRRFRKRSVNMEMLTEEQLKTIRDSFDAIDTQQTGYISTSSLSGILKANYRPSKIETSQVHSWLDRSGDGKVYFDDYVVVMASVMERAGIQPEQGIEAARQALSFEMQRRTSELCDTPAPTTASVNAAQEIVGETNLKKMQERWAILDTAKQGFLEKEQVRELIRLTYVPSEATIGAFMRVFEVKENGIARADFVQGMTLLNGDFSFAIQNS